MLRSQLTLRQRGQALVEFALVLPILLFMMMGIMDMGRALFTYGQASSQLREALRMAANVGYGGGGTTPPYLDCNSMRDVMSRVYFGTLSNTNIMYLHVYSSPTSWNGTSFNEPTSAPELCTGATGPNTMVSGDILRIRTDVRIDMITPFLPSPLIFTLQGQRTLVTAINIYSQWCGDGICQAGEKSPFCIADCAWPDLGISISAPDHTPVNVNDVVSYNVTVTNNTSTDPDHQTPAANVVVTYIFDPASIAYVSCATVNAPAGATCSAAASTITFTLGTMDWNTTAKMTFQIRVLDTTPLAPVVTVKTSSRTFNTTNDTATASSVTPQTVTDLYLTMTSQTGSGLLAYNGTTNLLLNLSSSSATPASNVTLTYVLPTTSTGLQIIGTGTVTVGATSYPGVIGTDGSGNATVTWGPIASFGPGYITPTVTVQGIQQGTWANKAWVSTSTVDPNLANNCVGITGAPYCTGSTAPAVNIQVDQPKAGVAISKSSSQLSITVGTPFTYTLTISNNGPDAAANVSVSDALPAGVTYASDDWAGTKNVAGNPLTFSLGNMANGASAAIHITVNPITPGTWANTATVSSPTFDPNTGDNSSSVSVTTLPLGQVQGLTLGSARCDGSVTRRFMGLSWSAVPGAQGYYIYANGTLVGQTWDGGGSTGCGDSIASISYSPSQLSGCFTLAPGNWVPDTTINYTVAAFSNPGPAIGPQSVVYTYHC